MSYTIVYNRQFLKIDDKIIPLVLYGSNNCYEIMWRGRKRRERSWNPMYLGSNKLIAITEKEFNRMKSKYILEEIKEGFWKATDRTKSCSTPVDEY